MARSPCPLVPWLVAGLLLATAPSAPGLVVHPRDGPDADVHFVLGETSLRAVIVLNLAFVDGLLQLPRQSDLSLDENEADALQAALLPLLAERNRVIIDGIVVPPRSAAFSVEPADERSLSLYPLSGARALTRVRLLLDHAVLAPPQRIDLIWGAFPAPPPGDVGRDAAAGVAGVVSEAPTGGSTDDEQVVWARLSVAGDELPILFRRGEPVFSWQRGANDGAGLAAVPALPVPSVPSLHLLSGGLLLALGLTLLFGGPRARRSLSWSLPATLLAAWLGWTLAVLPLPFGGATLPDESQALALFAPLHANIYRAFDYSSESDIYDALAASVEGELLATLYGQVYRGLVQAEQGGALARVDAVRPLETVVESIGTLPPDDRPGFTVFCRWQVDGVVRHWGHAHQATNEYRARYTVRAGEQGWRIASSEVLEQRKVAGTPITDPRTPAADPLPVTEERGR